MFFRLLFYVGKVAGVLFALFIGGTFVRRWVPEMDLLTRVILAILIPMCIAGACLGVAVFVFGMRMRCPFCRRLGQVGGGPPLPVAGMPTLRDGLRAYDSGLQAPGRTP